MLIMKEGLYKSFEDKFRGDREVVKERLEVYLPFVSLLKQVHNRPLAIDLGCGRGEWLELLEKNGLPAEGVDLDEGMLAASRDRGLQVKKADALSYIKSLSSETVSVVSAFHVVEHISFDALTTLIEESLRVLRPGGLLILETPNPENIIVGTSSFYLDPTHEKPIPPPLLSFLSEYYGFARTKVLRLQETKKFSENYPPTLTEVIEGASPDYAVMAQKETDQEIIKKFDSLFAKEYGVSLNKLSSLYDERIDRRFLSASKEAEEAKKIALETRQQLDSLFNSRSWRITAPLRWCGDLARRVSQGEKIRPVLLSLAKRKSFSVVLEAKKFLSSKPRLYHSAVRLSKLVGLYKFLSILSQKVQPKTNIDDETKAYSPSSVGQLSRREKEIYYYLRDSLKREAKS